MVKVKDLETGSIEVAVYDWKKRIIENAKVGIKPLQENKRLRNVPFDKKTSKYKMKSVKPGCYQIKVEAKGYATETRKIRIGYSLLKEKVILGAKNLPYYYRGKVRVPFEPIDDLVGLSVIPSLGEKDYQPLYDYAKELGLRREEAGKTIHDENIRIFRLDKDLDEEERLRIQRLLSEHRLVRLIGPIVYLDKEGVSFLTNELIVRFREDVTREDIEKIAKEYEMNIVRPVRYVPNGFLLRASAQASYHLLKIFNELAEREETVYAQPNLVVSAVDLQINPTDFLAPEQWHIPLINLPDAWQLLRNANTPGVNPGDPGDITFGSEDIVIAVLDRGIQSQTILGVTSSMHPDFDGTLTNGADKVYQFYDFANMVADNDAPPNNHGMGCAGVATGLAGNPSVVAGVAEGIVGAAPNCQVMGLIRPAGGTELQYTDAYIWMSGFDPGWVVDGVNYPVGTVLPAPISPGADVITNSFYVPGSVVVNGLMQDCFDFLTTYGRDGRGVPNFFAAGNSNQDFNLNFLWAAYEKTVAVAASTNLDVKSGYSNFGDGIDFCAPSSDGEGITTCNFVGQGNVPGHPAQQTTLSAAVAAGALTLNVASSAGFAAGDFILLGAPGGPATEACLVTGIPSGTQITVNQVINNHAAGDDVVTGQNDYRNDFGGTSSATPLAAGVAALMLSINPDLTWVQVRQILRDTAVKIDFGNADPVGQWVDTDGDGVNDYSQWYGYGRIDAQAAVQEAGSLVGLNPVNHIDTWIMENTADVGDVPSPPPYSPDVWVRNLDPAADDPAQVSQHQSPIRGQDNWVYVNVRNRGAVDSHDVYVRVFITRWAGTQYVYPDDFIPTEPPSANPIQPLAPGTYLIGEEHIDSIPAGGLVNLNMVWPAGLVPPASVTIDGVTYSWADACLLVDVSPHDGPAPTGSHTWDNNNICQRNVFPVDPGDTDTFAIGFVAGHRVNQAERINLVIERRNLPAAIRLYVDYVDDQTTKAVLRLLEEPEGEPHRLETCRLVFARGAKGEIFCPGAAEAVPVHIPPKTELALPCCRHETRGRGIRLYPVREGRKTRFGVPTAYRALVPVPRKPGQHQIIAIHGEGLRSLGKGEYLVDVYQEDTIGRLQGGLNFVIRRR